MRNLYVCCATDERYSAPCGIMLTSLFENNNDVKFKVFLLYDILSEESIEKFNHLAQLYHQEILYIKINANIFLNFPIYEGDHVTKATYYRIILPEIIPDSIHKILYLDCDIIVCGSVKKMYDTNINEVALGCVLDFNWMDESQYERLEYDSKKSYFNGGVLLLNLLYMRKNKITEQCFSWLNTHYEQIRWHDQDLLNHVCCSSKILLPLKYNLQMHFIEKNYLYNCSKDFQREIWAAIADPVIIHFSTRRKPWNSPDYSTPYINFFFHFLAISPWRGMKIKKLSLFKRGRTILRHILEDLGVKTHYSPFIINSLEYKKFMNKDS